jgi:flagellar basal body P-ring formation protein FlgA
MAKPLAFSSGTASADPLAVGRLTILQSGVRTVADSAGAAARLAAVLVLAGAATVAAQPAAPVAPGSHAQISQRVLRHVEEQTANLPGKVQISVGTIDDRSRLADCESMQMFMASGARLWGQTSVGVRCVAPQPWQIFVPVTVRVSAPVVIATRALATGTTIEAADVGTRTEDLTTLPGSVLIDPAQAIGRTLVSNLPGGSVLRADQFKAVWAVVQGQVVRVVYDSGGLSVTAEGKAMGNAAAGQPVDVRMSSGKTVRGIARSGGSVSVQ